MRVYRLSLALVLIATALLSVTAANAGSGNRPSIIPDAKERSALQVGDSRLGIDVKFVEGTDVRLRGKRLVSLGDGRIEALDKVLKRFPGLRISRLFASSSEQELVASRREALSESGRPQADLNLYFRIRAAAGTDTVALMDALNGLDVVDIAAPEPKPALPPATPSFVSRQGYRTAAASGGIDADYAQTLAGGKGENVTIVDIEYSWNRSHEDLSKARVAGSELKNGTPCDPFAATRGVHSPDHGTAVLGELGGDANGFGVTGLAPNAALKTVNASRLEAGKCNYNLADAILLAADSTVEGDVILLEQQFSGPNRTNPDSDVGYVPVEWNLAIWTAIRNATDRGRIVIEPAGNGYQNLDAPVYNASNGRNWFSYDSGAIMVGAGNAPGCITTAAARSRLAFSNYGSRLDVQGWGNCVMTTGYGAFQGGTDPNLWYTAGFNGTSSASPIVAASAAVLSSIAESRGTTLSPATARSLLKATGQPQSGTGQIGPLPNLKTAIAALGPALTDGGHLIVDGSTLGATTVPVRQSWNSSGSAAVQHEIWLSTDGGAYVKQMQAASSAVFQLERNHEYRFAARGKDAEGIWGDWAFGTTFHLGEYQENYSTANPVFTGSWTRAPWTPASDGFLSVSGTAGDRATFGFTGTNVAWVATKSTNRGEADVYVDNVFVKTVDLYSPTTTAQFIAFSKSWTASGQHTIEVRVRGTVGRPKVDVDAFVRLR